jgi:hypothetical protein
MRRAIPGPADRPGHGWPLAGRTVRVGSAKPRSSVPFLTPFGPLSVDTCLVIVGVFASVVGADDARSGQTDMESNVSTEIHGQPRQHRLSQGRYGEDFMGGPEG